MPYPGLMHPETLPLWQSAADSYLLRRHYNTILSQSLWSLWVLVHTRFCLCPLRVSFPSPVKFWQLYDGVNGNLLQEGLCHTQVCCTQSPCPYSSPQVTCTSSGDTQAQFDSKRDFATPTIFLGLLLCL